ncbi:MAG TPA: hypothetical protein VN714_03900 [Trebonia sp.]|nr:hypothetical protein [Trebonia sp.]
MNARSWLSWRTAWPWRLLLVFAALAPAAMLPAGLARAVIAVPVLFFVSGALTIGAAQARRSVDAVAFGSLAVVLSTLWLAFAALVLNALRIQITPGSVYVCLLVICAVLAVTAQWRQHRWPAEASGWLAASEGASSHGAWYAAGAAVASVALLAGGTFAYVHESRQVPAAYTWLAWTGAQPDGVLAVSRAGLMLPFQIRHEQSGTAAFRLTADWTGADGQQHTLAVPETMQLGGGQTVQAKLTIPPPPGTCVYRVVVALTELGGAHPQTWSINADVRAGQRPREEHGCA